MRRGVLWNSNLHAPMVSEIVAAAIAHGVRAVHGEGGSARAGHPHSADARLLNWCGPACHLRVEVKTGAEFGVSASRQCWPCLWQICQLSRRTRSRSARTQLCSSFLDQCSRLPQPFSSCIPVRA